MNLHQREENSITDPVLPSQEFDSLHPAVRFTRRSFVVAALGAGFALAVVDQLHAPVLGLYGGQDQGIPLNTVELMRQQFAESANTVRRASSIVVYERAGHFFNADYRPS